MISKRFRMPLIVLLAGMALAANAATNLTTKYVAQASVDFKAILQNPPADNLTQTRRELDEILSIQASRTPQQVTRVKSESKFTLAAFDYVIGPTFDFKTYPLTESLLNQVAVDVKSVTEEAKAHWDRTRPYDLDPAVKPAVDKPGNASYPSGHATLGYAWAIVLEQLFPEKKTELLIRADEIGLDRIIAGVHYHSDVVAGKKLGEAIAVRILKSEVFQSDLAAAKKELSERKY